MVGFSNVTIAGTLTADPELKYSSSGMAIANFSVAVNSKQGKEKTDTVDFFNVVMFDKAAEICSQYLSKGSNVLVGGKLKQDRWDGKDGQKHSVVKIVGNEVRFLSGNEGGGNKKGEDGDEVESNASDKNVPF